MVKTVDSFRFVSGVTRRVLQSWIKMESPGVTPWKPLNKPLSECTVALFSSGGIALKNDLPFDQEGERLNPWWGDPSFRKIPRHATEDDVEIYHLHINPNYARKDINCLLPLQHLIELESTGEIRLAAPTAYSIMGYLLTPERMLHESIPLIIENLRYEHVDVLVLIPS